MLLCFKSMYFVQDCIKILFCSVYNTCMSDCNYQNKSINKIFSSEFDTIFYANQVVYSCTLSLSSKLMSYVSNYLCNREKFYFHSRALDNTANEEADVTVTIVVTDANDEPPEITSPSSITLLTNTGIGTVEFLHNHT